MISKRFNLYEKHRYIFERACEDLYVVKDFYEKKINELNEIKLKNFNLIQLLGKIKLELEAGGEFTSSYYKDICNALEKYEVGE